VPDTCLARARHVSGTKRRQGGVGGGIGEFVRDF
jgi:hypothetical protein